MASRESRSLSSSMSAAASSSTTTSLSSPAPAVVAISTAPDVDSSGELTEAYAAALSSFVPEVVKHTLKVQLDKIELQKAEALAKGKTLRRDMTSMTAPWSTSFQTAALFADVRGFTNLTLRLSKKGSLGAEQLPRVINAYLGQIVRKIISYGGDVVKFAGDALLCVWPTGLEGIASPLDVRSALHMCTRCALDIQNEYGVMDLEGEADKHKGAHGEAELSVKLGIGVGLCSLLVVGGEFGRCEYLVCGDALMQAFSCEESASALAKKGRGQLVLLSAEGQRLLGSIVKTERVDGSSNVVVLRATGVKKAHFTKLALTVNLAQTMKGYIPVAVAPHLKMPSTLWTGELREVTIVFISLPFSAEKLSSINYDDVRGVRTLQRLQSHIRLLQKVIYQYEGSLNKFLVDDKGSTVMAVFGLPPVAHKNDAVRAVLAAIEVSSQLRRVYRLGAAALGISSGVVFSGLIGGAGSRREYTVLGDKVNMAARLMALAKDCGDRMGTVLCDDSIVDKCSEHPRLTWESCGPSKLKGIDGVVQVFKPVRTRYKISGYKISRAKTLEASDTENIHRIGQVLSAVGRTHKSALIFLEGEVMMGKTTLLEQIQVQNGLRAWFLWGKGDCFHSLHPVHNIVWKQVMLEFSKQYSLTLTRHRYKLLTWLKARKPDIADYAFLLQDIVDLGTDLEPPFVVDQRLCHALGSKERLWQMRFDLVICTLEWVARTKPIAIVLDEVHWFDRRDWQLTRRLCYLIHLQVLKNVIVLIGATPMDNRRYVPHFTPAIKVSQYTQMRDSMATLVISPQSWGRGKVRSYLCKSLQVADASHNLVEIAWSECGGRPGFVHLLMNELTEASKPKSKSWIHIEVAKKDASRKRAVFVPYIEDKIKRGIDVGFPIPAYIRSVTAAHLDCISTEALMCLKVASVIAKAKGNAARVFEEEMIRGMHPVPAFAQSTRLRRTLTELENMKFIAVLCAVPSMGTASTKPTRGLSTAAVSLQRTAITAPMPSTMSLLQPPLAGIAYKKGQMHKRVVKLLRKEKTRFFIFRHTTLYWLKNAEKEQYPVNRIEFTHKVTAQMMNPTTIKVCAEKKNYLLRCDSQKEASIWFGLFTTAILESPIPSTTDESDESKSKSSLRTVSESPTDESIDGLREPFDDDESDDDDDVDLNHVYEFSFGFLRDVTYESMLHSQRQILHQSAHKFLNEVLHRMPHKDAYTVTLHSKHQEFGRKLENMQRTKEALPDDAKARLKKKRKSQFIPSILRGDSFHT